MLRPVFADSQQRHCRGVHAVCCLQRDQVWEWQQVRDNIDSQARLVLDARGAGRWAGTAPEPRPGIKGGHMPGSKNVPFDQVLSNGRWGPDYGSR